MSERLEEIKEGVHKSLEIVLSNQEKYVRKSHVEYLQDRFDELYENVEELENEYQVKRVELLEEHIDRLQKHVEELAKDNKRLGESNHYCKNEMAGYIKQNQRYREALDDIHELAKRRPTDILSKAITEISRQTLERDTNDS